MNTTGKLAIVFLLSLALLGFFVLAESMEPGAATASSQMAPSIPATIESLPLDLVEDINGYQVADPFRWLEDKQKAKQWIEQQNERTGLYLQTRQTPGVAERIRDLYSIGYVSKPDMAGGMFFYLKLEKGAEQPRLVVNENGAERVLLDPIEIDPTGKTALDWYYPSRTGSYLAYGLSKNGDENSTLFILKVTDGEKLADQISHTRHCSLAWLSDDRGFYYTRYPDGSQYNRHVYYHQLGAAPEQDAYITGQDRKKTDWPEIYLNEDDQYLFINIETGTTTNDSYMLEVQSGKFTTLAENVDAQVWAVERHDGRIWALTTLDSPNMRLTTIDPNNTDPSAWRDLLPEREFPLRGYRLAKDRIVALYLENAVSRLRAYDLQGVEQGEIELPTLGSVRSLAGEPGRGEIVFAYSSFLYPNSLFVVDPTKSLTAKPLVVTPTGGNFDPDDFIVKYVEYPSYDGTFVPLFLVHKKGIALSGDNPTGSLRLRRFRHQHGGVFLADQPVLDRTRRRVRDCRASRRRGKGRKVAQGRNAGKEIPGFQRF